MIYATQCRDKRYTFVLVENRPAWVFDQAHRFVAVDGNHEYVSQSARVLKVSQVPDMQNIKAAIGEDYFLSFYKRRQIFKPAAFHSPFSSTACISSSKVTGRVPYFMTTIPPA